MCLFGTGYSGFGGWKGAVIIPEGGEFVVANALYPASSISTLPGGSKAVLQVSMLVSEDALARTCATAELHMLHLTLPGCPPKVRVDVVTVERLLGYIAERWQTCCTSVCLSDRSFLPRLPACRR